MHITSLSRYLRLFRISRRRLWVSVVIFILYSFAFYQWAMMSINTFRWMDGLIHRNLVLIPAEHMRMYSRLTAWVASLLGLAAALRFLTAKPRLMFGPLRRKIYTWIKDVEWLLWSFVYWAGMMLLAYALLGAYELYISLYDILVPPGWLAGAVLFLWIWTSWREVSFRLRMRAMAAALAVLVPFSWMLSHVNLMDIEKYDRKFLKLYHIDYSNGIRLPETHSFVRLPKPYLILDIWLPPQSREVLVPGGRFSWEMLPVYLEEKAQMFSEDLRPYLAVRLHADRETPMAVMDSIRQKIREAEYGNLTYAVRPAECGCPDYANVFEALVHPDFRMRTDTTAWRYVDWHVRPDGVEWNGRLYTPETLRDSLQTVLEENNLYFRLHYSPELSYGAYIRILDAIQSATLNLKNRYAKEHGFPEFDFMSRDLKDRFWKRHRWRVEDVLE